MTASRPEGASPEPLEERVRHFQYHRALRSCCHNGICDTCVRDFAALCVEYAREQVEILQARLNVKCLDVDSLTAQLQTLRGELAAWEKSAVQAQAVLKQHANCTQEKAALEARERALREALKRFGQHPDTCAGFKAAWRFESIPCDCGLAAALAPRPRHE